MRVQILALFFVIISPGLCDRACSRNTCLNGGTCTVNDETRAFQCDCKPGFSGLLCQDNCSLHCLHGKCVKGTFGEETCQCFEGWMGSLCDMSAQDGQKCTPSCKNDERCVEMSEGVYQCEKHVDPSDISCSPTTCQNNGTCILEENNVKCICSSGFSGKSCEKDIDECALDKCQNNAICENTFGDYNCVCQADHTGKNCDILKKKTCPADYCKNNGRCTTIDEKFECSCSEGFEGEFCENEITVETTTSSCKCDNPAHQCNIIHGEMQCNCPDGFTGVDCKQTISKPCDAMPCKNNGVCSDDGNNLFTCSCLPQYTGVYCSEPVECLVNGTECQNGGKCSFSLAGMTFCECESGFSGTNCEIPNFKSHKTCDDIRCENGGSCTLDAQGEPYCNCVEGFDPPYCNPKSECQMNPCKNNGTCQDVDGIYFCHCKDNYVGMTCDTKKETATLPPTLHPLHPTFEETDSKNDIEMTCDECMNSSNCLEKDSGSICLCKNGFMGAKCEQAHNKCSTVTCPTGQICIQNSVNSHNVTTECSCPIGHFGSKCEMETSATFSAQSLYIHQSSKFSLGTSSFDKVSFELEFSFRTTVENAHLASSENILGEKILSISLDSGYLVFNVSGFRFDEMIPMKLNDANWYTVILGGENEKILLEVLTENGFSLQSTALDAKLDVFLTRFGKISTSNFFTGCLADVRVDGELIIFSENKRAFDIRKGCARSEQCSRDYCQNDGTCVDHWESSSCKCKSPYLKPNCAHSLPKTTFGHLNKPSIVHLSTSETENHLLRNEIDLNFLMRSRVPEAVLFYIGEKHNNADVLTNYLVVKIAGGLVTVNYRTGGRKEIEFQSKNKVNDNEEHVVRIHIDRSRREITIDELVEISEPITSRMSQEFYVDEILIGSSNSIASDTEYFKGYLQDIQINEKSVVLHPTTLLVDSIGKIEKVTNIVEGAISDPVCNNSVCKYGDCTETFNDFICKCSDGFTGRHCDKIDYCRDTKCLNGSKCENSDDGFYCVFPVTISDNSKIVYELKPKTISRIESVSFSIRTHSQNGHIFTLIHANSALKVMIFKRRLLLANEATNKFQPIISDGKWHKLVIDQFKISIDGQTFAPTSQLFKTESQTESEIFFGKQLSDPVLACIDDFKIDDYPLFSFTKQEVPTKMEQWKMTEKVSVGTGCISAEQCGIFSTCQNGGTCTDVWNKRKCNCPPGFSGEHCEENINECKFMDCGSHGYCVDKVNSSECVCNDGFYGDRCEHTDDECEGVKCHNSGKCVKKDDEVVCECVGPWMGGFCNLTLTSSCMESPCQNSGECIQKTPTSLECNCMEGYSGKYCETKTFNKCSHDDCNRGHCVMTISGPACQCELGFAGRFCEKLQNQCTSHSCSSRGTCFPSWNGTLCSCEKDWRGPSCQYQTDSCLDFPCENDGICSTSENASFKCECQKYYMGTRCEIEGSCLKASCVNGECIQQTPQHHTCSCNIGYEGEACDKRIDYCKSTPCMNGGACENMLTGYKCQCPVGFDGSDCETNIDECAFGYCSNGAKCRDKINDYECICDGTGYQGKNCTMDVNECEIPQSCINGDCSNTLGGYKCSCRNGFIGPRCSMRNPCTSQISSNNISSVTCVHGKCVNPVVHIENRKEVAKYECACDRGYTGPTCSQRIKETSMSNIGYLFGPIIAIVVVFAILGLLLLLFVIRGNNAMHGHYSPSSHEFTQNRMAMPTVIKLPPQERLI